MIRYLVLASVLALSACGTPSQLAARTCTDNGYMPGTALYLDCFQSQQVNFSIQEQNRLQMSAELMQIGQQEMNTPQ